MKSAPHETKAKDSSGSGNDGNTNQKSHGRSRSFDYLVSPPAQASSTQGQSQSSSQYTSSAGVKLSPQTRSPRQVPASASLKPAAAPDNIKMPTFTASGTLEATIETPRTPRGERINYNMGIATVGSNVGTETNSLPSMGNFTVHEFPTDLHRAVASKTTTLSQLRTHLLARPSAAQIKDSGGRLPLHILSLNKDLVGHYKNVNKEEELMNFILELFQVFPQAIVQADSDGRIPFSYALIDWIETAHNANGGLSPPNQSSSYLNPHQSTTASAVASSVGADVTSYPDQIQYNAEQQSSKKLSSWRKSGKRKVSSETEFLTGKKPSSSRKAQGRTGTVAYRPIPPTNESSVNNPDPPLRATSKHKEHPRRGYPSSQRPPHHTPGGGGSIATATISQMDGSASYADMQSIGGWTLEDVIPYQIRVDSLAHWDFMVLSRLLKQLQSDAKSGSYKLSSRHTDMSNTGGGLQSFPNIDRQDSFKDQVSLSSQYTDPNNKVTLSQGPVPMTPPPKTLRIQHSNPPQSAITNPLMTPSPSVHPSDIGNDPAWLATILISNVASIPSLLKIILCISDQDPKRDIIFHCPIVTSIFQSQYSVGNWLVHMLEHPSPSIAKHAVDYLDQISSSSTHLHKVSGMLYLDNQYQFRKIMTEKDHLYTKIGNLDHFLISLLGLQIEEDMQRGSSSLVVQYILHHQLCTTSVLVVALMDLMFHFILIVTFQHFSNLFFQEQGRLMEGLTTYYLTMVAIIYLIIRKVSHYSVMLKMSWKCFFRYSFRWLDLLDVFSLILALVCMLMMEIRLEEQLFNPELWFRELVAIATLMIWCKFVGFLYMVNLEVKYYICIIGENMRNIRWILFFLAMGILAFSQMMHVILSSPLICTPEDPASFCSQNSYLQAYSILLGTFDESEFDATVLSALLFVFYSFITIIVLFTSLIAMTVKTFSSLSSSQPYGETRLTYFAEVKAFQRLLLGQWSLVQYCSIVLFLCSIAVVVLLSVASMRDLLLEQHGDVVIISGAVVLLLFVWVSVLAFFSHITFYDFMEVSRRSNHTVSPSTLLSRGKYPTIKWILHYLSSPIRFAVEELLGISKKTTDRTQNLFRIPNSMEGEEDSKSDTRMILNEMKKMEKEMRELQNRTKVEIMAQIRNKENADSFLGSARKS